MNDHNTSFRIELMRALPAELECSNTVPLQLRVIGKRLTDWSKLQVLVSEGGRLLGSSQLSVRAEDYAETDLIQLNIPNEVGQYTWTIEVRDLEPAESRFGQGIDFSFTAVPPKPEILVWDTPPYAEVGKSFNVKVAVRRAPLLVSVPAEFIISEDGGREVAKGQVCDALWPGTTNLYWTEVAVPAGDKVGVFRWLVALAGAGAGSKSAAFSTTVIEPPSARIDISVRDESGHPVEGVTLRCGPITEVTDKHGRAQLPIMPESHVAVWKQGYKPIKQPVSVEQSSAMEIILESEPEEISEKVWM